MGLLFGAVGLRFTLRLDCEFRAVTLHQSDGQRRAASVGRLSRYSDYGAGSRSANVGAPRVQSGAATPVPARLFLWMLRVDRRTRRRVGLHRHVAPPDRVEVLLQTELPPAGVLEDGDAGEVDGALPARMISPVLQVDDDAAAVGVDDVPLVGGV